MVIRIKMRIHAYMRLFISMYELAYCLSTVSGSGLYISF